MAVKKLTGNPILDSVISSLEKKLSKPVVSIGPLQSDIASISTGSLGLDIAIGIGGYPVGRCIEIFGQESSGKTSLALAGLKSYQLNQVRLDQADRWSLVVDAEHTITENQYDGYGIDKDKTLFTSPDSTEEALQTILDLAKSGQIGFVILDSIDALQTEAILNKELSEAEMGGSSKPLNRFFREFSKISVDHNITSIFINQIKYKLGQMMGNPETTPGGTAPRFYSSLRLRMSPAKPSPTTPNAFRAKVQIKKNKCHPPVDRDIEFDFIYNQGPDPVLDVLNTAKDLGIVAFAGPSLRMEIDGEVKTICSGGEAGWIEAVAETPALLETVRNKCLATLVSSND